MGANVGNANPRLACDAMCGGLARWLRVLGIDASYTPGIEDGELVRLAQRERRVLLSSDGKIFERRLLTTGEVAGLRLPVGLRLHHQLEFVVTRLNLRPRSARCTLCNGELAGVERTEVADIVPVRSLIWAEVFHRCTACGYVFWEGSHWRRIRAVRNELMQRDAPKAPPSPGALPDIKNFA